MRRLAILLLLPALVLGAAACGGDEKGKATSRTTVDSGSGSKPSGDFVDAMVKNFTSSSDGIITKANAECAASKLDGALSGSAKDTVVKSDADLTKLSKDDQDAVVQAFDECVPIDALAQSLTASMGDASMTDTTKSCIASAIKDKYDSSGDLMKVFLLGTQQAQEELTSLYTGCIPETGPGSVSEAIAQSLQTQGVTKDQAECVANSLSSKYSASDLAALQGGAASTELQQAIVQLMGQCGVDPSKLGQ